MGLFFEMVEVSRIAIVLQKNVLIHVLTIIEDMLENKHEGDKYRSSYSHKDDSY